MKTLLTGLLACALLAACSGEIFIVEPSGTTDALCVNVSCLPGSYCKGGQCLPIPSTGHPCTPLNPSGDCAPGEVCVQGTCYASAAQPAACAVGHNGTCPLNKTCDTHTGTCEAITTPCDTTHSAGQCQGGQRCISGYCYNDTNLSCSVSQFNGVCPDGQLCNGGNCQALGASGLCSASNFTGLCSAWETCAEGLCIGPVPPATLSCSAANPTGICPSQEVCVGGVCTAFATANVCSAKNPTGLCAAGAACSAGRCEVITAGNACSAAHQTGLCSGGAACLSGICVQTACGQPGGWKCSEGTWCVNDQCVPVLCDPVHPGGACNDTTLACGLGVCQPPTCSGANPNGTCQTGLVCTNGNCTLPACSAQSQNGPCPTPDLECNAGVCVKKACSLEVLDGVCTGAAANANIMDPYFGPTTVPAVCCDPNLHAVTSCTLGSCAAPACAQSPNGMHGACAQTNSQYCNNGVCVAAPCTPFFQGGVCADSNQVCSQGVCTKPNCINQADPNGYCAPLLCDGDKSHTITYNTCISPPCASDPNIGVCAVGLACCNPNLMALGDPNCTSATQFGQCISPVCSRSYPGGACPGNDFCSPSQGCAPSNPNNNCCATPPCSIADRAGNCGPNFSCDSTINPPVCTLNDCSPTSPAGKCIGGQLCLNTVNDPNVSPSDPNFGHCQTFACSNYYPNAPCPVGQICVNQSGTTSCQVPQCGTTYPAQPGGVCSNANDICAAGVCVPRACNPNYTSGACPGTQVCCDSTLQSTRGGCALGTCIQGPCDANNTGGWCPQTPTPQVCCSSSLSGYANCSNPNTLGTCVAEVCSPTYPSGPCPTGEICVSGTCQTPCSNTQRTGWCATGFACVDGICASTCPGDLDCDNIADSIECPNPGNPNAPSTCADFDGDGSPNIIDRDSDNDTIPDVVEKGCVANGTSCTPSTPLPTRTTTGTYDFLNLDSDNDHILDRIECGPVPSIPVDTDGDGTPDYRDTDSDGDGVIDSCEGPANSQLSAMCGVTSGPTNPNNPSDAYFISTPEDTNHDGKPDYLSLDSDGDGVSDHLESIDTQSTLFNSHGVQTTHGTPDFRNLDSDSDGIPDKQEDINGNGYADCQLDGNGNFVIDSRATPACGGSFYWNPGCNCSNSNGVAGCVYPNTKCVFAETSRVVPDTNLNHIQDANDGIYLVCANGNLKSINLFYSQSNDYAFALEQNYNTVLPIPGNGGGTVGITFDDTNSNASNATINGSYGVSGFLIAKVPNATAMAQTTLLQKAITQAQSDGALIGTSSLVTSSSVVTTRNFTTFDNYAAVVTRFSVNVSNANTTITDLRDSLVNALDLGGTFASGVTAGPSANSLHTSANFTVNMLTLYRYDDAINGAGGTTGRVIVVLTATVTGTNETTLDSYNYRPSCGGITSSGLCLGEHGCTFTTGQCTERSDYQIPLFFADNATNGSAIGQYGSDLAAVCQSLVQQNGILDYLWVVDNSISMAPKIGQVTAASGLFFGFLNNTEADYRVGMTTTAPSIDPTLGRGYSMWQPTFPGCFAETTQAACETASTTSGCSWDPNNQTCVPACTPYGDQASCNAAGCTWNAAANSNNCYFGGCSSVAMQSATPCNSFGCYWNSSTSTCTLTSRPERTNGSMITDFTGAIAGQFSTNSNDRSVTYQCSDGCATEKGNGSSTLNNPGLYDTCANIALHAGSAAAATCAAYPQCYWTGSTCVANCCPICNGIGGSVPSGAIQSPNCFFASRLPGDDGNGFEFGLLMAEWAMYRGGARSSCSATQDPDVCATLSGCVYYSGNCIAAYCDLSSYSYTGNQELNECNGNYPQIANPNANTTVATINTLNTPPRSDVLGDPNSDLDEPAACEWDPVGQACVPNIGQRCSTYGQTDCPMPRCTWQSGACIPNPISNTVQCNATNASACYLQGPNFCTWDTCGYGTQTECEAVYGCEWTGSCGPSVASPNGVCRPPLKRAFRNNSTHVAVILSDEEECFVKDGASGGYATPYDGHCEFANYGGGLMNYNDTLRLVRTNSYLGAFVSRNFLAYALVGDKADPTRAAGPAAYFLNGSTCPAGCTWYSGDPTYPNSPDGNNNGIAQLNAVCVSNANPNLLCPAINGGCYNPVPNGPTLEAEAGQAYINVAEGTGGGWGSICASDLYPSIEATVIASVGKASPYKLYGFVNGHNVQAISSSIQVGVQTCTDPNFYPNCNGGGVGNTYVMVPIPRSRNNGFDYDPTSNAIVLYGNARAFTKGDIVISYRYWVNNNEPAAGADPTCPCPGTSGPACNCPPGESCGVTGANPVTASNDKCAQASNPNTRTQAGCDAIAGCTWNTVLGCEPTGVCKADPTCGGSCGIGHTCDASTGLCECDLTCGGGCSAGKKCDTNTGNNCATNSDAVSCGNASGCAWNNSAQTCESATCGQCLCDTTCGGGCPAGQKCDTTLSDLAHCGQCLCDTTCNGHCPPHQACNSDVNSPTCGFCEAPTCSYVNSGGNTVPGCPTGQVCNQATGVCVCDTTCGGSCRAGTTCDGNPNNTATCGTCVCQANCGNITCPAGEKCDSNPADTSTCGLCVVDPTCGGSSCNPSCSYGTVSTCNADSNCIWKTWQNAGHGACGPKDCQTCNPTSGLCGADTTCCGGCGSGEVCDVTSGSCKCDTTCGGTCRVGYVCDANPTSANCGTCQCDTTCGGTCPKGDRCDTASTSPTCGQCVIDPTCGGGCPYPYQCDSNTGLCAAPPCGGCPQGYKCDSSTLQCVIISE